MPGGMRRCYRDQDRAAPGSAADAAARGVLAAAPSSRRRIPPAAPAQRAPEGVVSSREEGLQSFVPQDGRNNPPTFTPPLVKGDGFRFPVGPSHGSCREPRDAAALSSRVLSPGRGAAGPPPPAWHQLGKWCFSFSPQELGKGHGAGGGSAIAAAFPSARGGVRGTRR